MKGVITALVTPFKRSGEIDFKAFEKLLISQGESGIHGVVPCGTTGESVTLTVQEKKKLIECCVQTFKHTQTKVIAGTGTNNTDESVDLSKWASKLGVDGILAVTPYYNKPSQRGLIAHYQAISKAIQCPLIPYNVPGRTAVSMTTETILSLARISNVTALKEATGNLAWNAEILFELKKKKSKLSLLSGDDPTFLPFLALGGEGIISVASNLIPKVMLEIYSKRDRDLFLHWTPLFKSLFIESNPGPIKYAMNLVYGLPSFVRLPLVEIEPNTKAILQPLIQGIRP